MTSDNPVGKRRQAPSFKIESKQRMIELGITVEGLRKTLGLSRTSVSLAINHESMFPAVKQRIRGALGL